MMKKTNSMWRIWAKALGEKSGRTDREADIIAGIRTFIFIQLIVTNCFIVAGNIRHWNDAHMEKSLREPLEFVNLC